MFLLKLVLEVAAKFSGLLKSVAVKAIRPFARQKILDKLREYMGVSQDPKDQDWWQTYKADLLGLGTGSRGPYPLRRWNECKGRIPTVMKKLSEKDDLSLFEAQWERTVGPTVFVKPQVEPTTGGGTRTWWGTMQKVVWKLELLRFR